MSETLTRAEIEKEMKELERLREEANQFWRERIDNQLKWLREKKCGNTGGERQVECRRPRFGT
jgi:hypothetical protein